jgi:hypothetical protein
MGKHSAKKRKTATAKKRRQTATKTKVDARVWKAALRLAGGDALRIQVKSPTEVVVNNKRKGGK